MAIDNKITPDNERSKLVVVELFIKHRANLDTVDNLGWTALMMAARNGTLRLARG